MKAITVVIPRIFTLKHVGLLRVGYRGLEGLCTDDTRWGFHPAVAALPSADREALMRTVLE